MKTDTQHLDYLISQYVDGCLDPASKKSLEQKMVNDPEARAIYKDHRDVQDVLEDWGNRIPLINWDEFDKKLAGRLEHETVGGGGISIFRRWTKPLAIAASLFVAASVGYGWHALSTTSTPSVTHEMVAGVSSGPSRSVAVEQPEVPMEFRRAAVRVEEQSGVSTQTARNDVTISAPTDVAAAPQPKSVPVYGLGSIEERAQPNAGAAPSSVQAMGLPRAEKKNPVEPGYPYP